MVGPAADDARGLPLVGPAAGGLFVHGGHASLGMQAAPATAAWLAADMHGEPWRTDAAWTELRPGGPHDPLSQRVQSMLRMTMTDMADAADDVEGAFRLENADT